MIVIQNLVTSLKKSFDFSGTATRQEYWTFYVFYNIVIIITGVDQTDYSGGLLPILVVILLLIPAISIGFRRMRDIGRNRWLSIIPLYGQALALIPSKNSDQPLDELVSSKTLEPQKKPNILMLLLASLGILIATSVISQSVYPKLSSVGIDFGSSVMNQPAQSVMSPSGINSTIATWGISLNDSSGPRSLGDVVEDMWNYLNANASGSGDITKNDMEIALQPGNSVYNILQTLFVDQQTIDDVAARLIKLSR